MLIALMVVMLPIQHMSHATEICSSKFPNRETTLLLEGIVQRYAHEEMFIDYTNGIRTTRKVITEPTLTMAATHQLYLEPKFISRECTHRFETKRFFRVPIYVHLSPNEEAHPFNRLHFTCPPQTTCCGLFCCPQETYVIQEEFIALSSPATDSSDFRRIDGNSHISRYGSTYSLKEVPPRGSNEHLCVYQLSDEDALRRTVRLTSEQPPNAIYFLCPRTSKCCQLKCTPNSTILQDGLLFSNSLISANFSSNSTFHNYKIYAFCSIVFLLLLGTVSFVVYRVYESRKLLRCEQRSPQLHTNDANTSEFDSQTPIDQLLKSYESDIL